MGHRRGDRLPDFKAKVALVAVKSDRAPDEAAQQFDAHSNPMAQRKCQRVESAAQSFDGGKSMQTHLATLHAKTGKLSLI